MFVNIKNWLISKSQSGDTIIEVLLSVSILGLILALSFSSSSRSLNAGTDAANRSQALAYASQQVEFLRDDAANGSLKNLPADGSLFCIDPSTGNVVRAGSDNLCHLSSQGFFGVSIKYNSANQTYNVISSWQGKLATNQVSLYYQAPLNPITAAPNINIGISASPTYVPYQGTSTITWSATSQNSSGATVPASSCTASGGWSGSKTVSGSYITPKLTETATFYLTCIGSDGVSSTTKSVKVTVSQLPKPVFTNFSATPLSVKSGASSTLAWSVSNAATCTASDGWNGTKSSSGSQQVGPIYSAQVYTLQCYSADQVTSTSQSVTVSVLPAPTLNFSADSYSLPYGGSTILRWSAANASSCLASGSWNGYVSTSGSSSTGALSSSRTYNLQCSGDGGSVTKSVTINVSPPPPPTPLVETLPAEVVNSNTVYFQMYVNPQGSSTHYYYKWSITPDMSACVLYDDDPGGFQLGAADYNWHYDISWGRTTINGVTTPVNYYNCDSNSYYYQACAYNAYGTTCGATYQLYL